MSYRHWILQIQPVPKNNWGDNLAHLLPKPVWDKLRREVYDKADHKCEICGKEDEILHCHEDWTYDDRNHIQSLRGLLSLCKSCHDCIHWFRTERQVIGKKGKEEGYPIHYLGELKDHFVQVNKCTYKSFGYYIKQVTYLRDLRLRNNYSLVYNQWGPKRIVKLYGLTSHTTNKSTR